MLKNGEFLPLFTFVFYLYRKVRENKVIEFLIHLFASFLEKMIGKVQS